MASEFRSSCPSSVLLRATHRAHMVARRSAVGVLDPPCRRRPSPGFRSKRTSPDRSVLRPAEHPDSRLESCGCSSRLVELREDRLRATLAVLRLEDIHESSAPRVSSGFTETTSSPFRVPAHHLSARLGGAMSPSGSPAARRPREEPPQTNQPYQRRPLVDLGGSGTRREPLRELVA